MSIDSPSDRVRIAIRIVAVITMKNHHTIVVMTPPCGKEGGRPTTEETSPQVCS